ncbi:MAG: ROK family protein [Acidobacteriota bacterium]|nr:ROK family protein [Acidobacteriota bacterium]
MTQPLYGGIEAGGTKFICAVGSGPRDLVARIEFPTTSPKETIARTVVFFRGHAQQKPAMIGIGSFGPVDLHPDSPKCGWITSTPKEGWRNTDLAGAIREGTGVNTVFDTDVNAAALGEFHWGAGQGLNTFLYLTIGTGIGGGGMVNGRLMHGLLHPEMGHIRVPHDWAEDPYAGACPFHGDCLEGLASGRALEGRWGYRGEDLPDDHPAWELEGHYLALGIVNWICTLSPERIILGGGLMRRAAIFGAIRNKVKRLLNRYLVAPEIVPPALGNDAGILGAIALAKFGLSGSSAGYQPAAGCHPAPRR